MGISTAVPGIGRKKLKRPHAPHKPSRVSAEFVRGLIVTVFIAIMVLVNLSVGVAMIFGKAETKLFADDTSGPTGPTAVVMRPMLDGTFCRYSTFDNRSAKFIEDKVELCGTHGRSKRPGKTAFSWGG